MQFTPPELWLPSHGTGGSGAFVVLGARRGGARAAMVGAAPGALSASDFGRPLPTDAWDKYAQRAPAYRSGVDSLDLATIPYNDLPSGGDSNRISPSEMFLALTLWNLVDQGQTLTGGIQFVWLRDDGTALSAIYVPVGTPPPGALGFYAYSFIGHFGRAPNAQGLADDHDEILVPADYFCDVSCNLGKVRFGFHVTDSSAGVAVQPSGRVRIDTDWVPG